MLPSAPPSTESEPTSRYFRKSPSASSCAFSTTAERKRVSNCPNGRRFAGMGICRTSNRGNGTASGCMDRGCPTRGAGAIRPSCCSIRTPKRSTVHGTGTKRCSRTTLALPRRRATISTAGRSCRRASSSTRSSTGGRTGGRARLGIGQSSMKRTSKGLRRLIRRYQNPCAVPTPGWRTPSRSSISSVWA